MEGVISIGAAEVHSDVYQSNMNGTQNAPHHPVSKILPSSPSRDSNGTMPGNILGTHQEHQDQEPLHQKSFTLIHQPQPHGRRNIQEPNSLQHGQDRRHRRESTGDSQNFLRKRSPQSQSLEQDVDHDRGEKYRALESRLSRALEDNLRMHQELDKSHRRVRNLRKEKNILLDRLSVLERRNSASGTDSEGTVSSDNDSDSSVMTRIRTRQIIALRDSALHAAKEAARANSQGQGAKTSRTSATTQKRGPNTKSNSTSFSATKESKLSGPISAPVASTITNVGSATQKPKRIHQSNKPRADLNKVRKVVTLPKDENGAVKLPVTIGILTVWSIGYVVHDREAFHNERYIWPVGYKVSRSYNSMVDPTKQTVYTCSVIDDGDAPKFQIDAEDQPESPIIAGTATGAWTHIVKAANLIRRRDHSNSASGPDYYGFSHATIAKMIQDLPNADKCTSYIMHRFEEIPPAPVSTPTTSVTTAGTNEKRKISSIARGKKSKPAESQEDGLEGKDKASQDTGNVGDIDDTEDDDAYASLGTPGKKKVRVASPKIRQAGFGEIGSATMSMETEDIMMVTNIGNSGQKKLTMEEDEDTLSESESDPRLSTATRPSENDTPVANDVAAVEATESGSPGSDVDIGDEGEIEVEVDIVGYSGMTVEDDT